MSVSARCSPVIGTDFTQDDDNVPGGFSANIARFDAKYLRDQKILVVTAGDLQKFKDLSSAFFYRPLLLPKPSVVKWELRDMYVVDVRRIPSLASGYCYGSRVWYVDKETFQVLWTDLYDANMKLWKTLPLMSLAAPVPRVGTQLMAWKVIGPMIDFQNSHMTLMQLDDAANEDCKNYNGTNYTDTNRYSSITGLNEILR
jgi:hypothetical protein